MITVRLPESVEKRLSELAAATGRPKSFYVREAVLEALDDLEDRYLAEREVERIRSGESRIWTSEEVERILGLDD
ncbi:DUF6290 family protein [Sutterella sp.]|uniref:type II toxin-antitoxin system RelB family antitoxin n=1 Tax=Sutterella sp. TaxID=1981025 RepID=UPI0026E0B7E7|nr:DUF6290 family protein [Sutterella sp.]MDO5532233.1 DUF6290 family protein [Sutterella sp.]